MMMVIARSVVVSVMITMISVPGHAVGYDACGGGACDCHTGVNRLTLVSISIVRGVTAHRGKRECTY